MEHDQQVEINVCIQQMTLSMTNFQEEINLIIKILNLGRHSLRDQGEHFLDSIENYMAPSWEGC